MSVRAEERTRVLVARDHTTPPSEDELALHSRRGRDYALVLDMSSGLGVSLVSSNLAEVIYLHTRAIKISHHRQGTEENTEFSVKQIQVR